MNPLLRLAVFFFRLVINFMLSQREAAIKRVKKREAKRAAKALEKKKIKDEKRKAKVGNTIDPNDPWNGLSK